MSEASTSGFMRSTPTVDAEVEQIVASAKLTDEQFAELIRSAPEPK